VPAVVERRLRACACIEVPDHRTATAEAVNVPSSIPGLHKAHASRHCGIAEYLGVVDRVDAGEAARLDGPAPVPAILFVVIAAARPNCRPRHERAQPDDHREHDTVLLSSHGNLLSVGPMTVCRTREG